MSASHGESSSAINIQCKHLREMLKSLEEKREALSRAAEENLIIRLQLQLLCQKTFHHHLQCAGTEASDDRAGIELKKLIKENTNTEILILEMCKIIAKICDESYRLLSVIQDNYPELFSDLEEDQESQEYSMGEIETDTSEEDDEEKDDDSVEGEKED